MTMRFKVGEVYLTRAGKKRRIVSTEMPGTHPILSIPHPEEVVGDILIEINSHLPSGAIFAGLRDEDDLSREWKMWERSDWGLDTWSIHDDEVYLRERGWRLLTVREVTNE